VAVVVVLPAILAREARSKRFELEAETVGDALRALPVSDLLFDERGALRPLVNVYVDGIDMRDRGGVDAPLAPGQTLRVVQAVAGG
jgi:molybdopterin converting factor small subunit